MIERLPPIHLADLKSGDLVLVSSPKGSDPARATAIALVAGLEAFLPDPGTRRPGVDISPGLPAGMLDMGIILP